MKEKTDKKIALLPFLLMVIMMQFSCSDNVNLPTPFLKTDKSLIVVSPGETTVNLLVESNWEWTLEVEDEQASWLSIDGTTAFGNLEVELHIDRNISVTRSAVIKIYSKKDNSIQTSVEVKQYSLSEADCIPVSEIRKLAENLTGSVTEYAIDGEMNIRGIVVSNGLTANFSENCFAIQDGYDALSGITVKTQDDTWFAMGDEVQVPLKGATLKKNSDGVLELHPPADDTIEKTEVTAASPRPAIISYEELVRGDYESMYVGIPEVQVQDITDTQKLMEGSILMQDADNNRFTMYTYSTSAFATTVIPTGSGQLNGIATLVDGNYAVKPCLLADFSLTSSRLGATGIRLPYVFSLLAKGPGNTDGMVYCTRTGTDNDPMNQVVFANDGNGMQLTFNGLTGNDNAATRVTYWIETSGHHNLPTKSWITSDPHFLFTIPLDEDISDTFRFSFGIGSTARGPKDWKVLYSTDNNTWIQSDDNEVLSIPDGLTIGSQKNFFYFSTFITPTVPLPRRSTLYIKLTPATDVCVSGLNIVSGGESRLHSAIVLDRQSSDITSFPSNAIYSEGFDRIFGGYDYLLGDKLSAMVAYSGKDISQWTTAQKAGLTGTNVRERVGYIQLGYSDTERIPPKSLENAVGELITPKLSSLTKATDVTLTFKAMAYKTMALAGSSPNDAGGDITNVYLEIVGDGTFEDGGTTKELVGMNHSSFSNMTVNINGATANTQIKFTSKPESGQFSRWFLDDICVAPK